MDMVLIVWGFYIKIDKNLTFKKTLVNFAEGHCTNSILYIELGSI